MALDNGEVVAISCHMCSANVPASTQHVVNAFMDLHGLQQHYRIKHKDEVNVVGKGVQEVVRICRKDLLSKGDLERVVNREPPRTPSLMASKGRGMLRIPALVILSTDKGFSRSGEVQEEAQSDQRQPGVSQHP